MAFDMKCFVRYKKYFILDRGFYGEVRLDNKRARSLYLWFYLPVSVL